VVVHIIGHAFFIRCGHEVKAIAPQFITAYRKGNKNDYNDAEAIAEPLTVITCALAFKITGTTRYTDGASDKGKVCA